MKLTTKTRYGVRAMFDIAYHCQCEPGEPGGTAQAKDIARRGNIPLRYLEQIFADLKRAGLVESKRGPRGGYALKRPPAEISLFDMVVAIQGPINELFAAPGDSVNTGLNEPVSQHVAAAIWKELAAQVTKWLSAVSLADLVQRGIDLGVPRPGSSQPMYFI